VADVKGTGKFVFNEKPSVLGGRCAKEVEAGDRLVVCNINMSGRLGRPFTSQVSTVNNCSMQQRPGVTVLIINTRVMVQNFHHDEYANIESYVNGFGGRLMSLQYTSSNERGVKG
jgi:hypothetical protein